LIIHTVGSIVLGGLLFYAMFADEFEYEIEEEQPKLKAPAKSDVRKMKKNGQWVDVKVTGYNDNKTKY
jgi:hypothetical protein